MASAHESLARISTWLWPTLLHHLWQATLFTGVVWLFCFLAKRASSKTRYGIWLLASFKFVVPALLFAWIAALLNIHIPWPTNAMSASSTRLVMEFPLSKHSEEEPLVIGVLESNTPRREAPHKEFYCSLTVGWALGCVFFLRAWWRLHRTVKTRLGQGEQMNSGSPLETLHRVKRLLREQRPMSVIVSSEFPEPGVCGIRNPKVVLPKGVVEALTEQELEAVMLHEVAHVRRHDNLVSAFQSWLCCVFWFYPVVWIIDRQLLAERERACDEEVLLHTVNRQDYLSSLLKVFRLSLGEKMAGASLITGSNLKRRIDHMQSHGSRNSGVLWHRLTIFGFALALMVSAAATALLNQRSLVAQDKPESSTVVTPKDKLSKATSNQAVPGVRSGEITGRVTGGVTVGISGRAKGGVQDKPVGSGKRTPEQPLGVAMNQTRASSVQQAGSAKLFGTVSDASRARIPDATIVLADKEGGTKEITFSNAAGEYEFRALPLSRYSLAVRKPGFRAFEQQALELQANESRNLDVVLDVGEVDQTVNVVAKAPAAPPPDVRSGPPRRIRVGGNVQQTKLVHQVQPVYPERAQAQGIQGSVLLEAVILMDGNLGTIRVVNKLADPELVNAAVEAVKSWRYEPTLLNGQPIEVLTTIAVNFRLSSS